MVDKIIGNKGMSPLGTVNRSSKTSGSKKSSSAQVTDRVEFSSALQNAARTQGISATQETTRSEKLQALKAQIENGTYKPDLDQVASSLLPFILKDS